MRIRTDEYAFMNYNKLYKCAACQNPENHADNLFAALSLSASHSLSLSLSSLSPPPLFVSGC